MEDSLLNKIPVEILNKIKLYRLGVFENKSFEFIELKKDEDYIPHFHKNSQAKFYFIFGEGLIFLNGKTQIYKKGDFFLIKKGMKHGFKPKTETLFLSIQTPPIKNQKTGKEDFHF